jgi:predicted Zn-dependent peptidase
MNIEERKAAIEEIRRISRENDGKVSAQLLFDTAKADKNSPLRPIFEWDNDVAFAAHNVDRARRFIASVKVKITNETKRVTAVAYVRDPECAADEQGYVSVDKVKTDEDLKREVLLKEFDRLAAIMNRAKSLAHYFDAEEQVEALFDELQLVRLHIEGIEARH